MTNAAALGPYLPYLRRYARALTGSQDRGDSYVRATLVALLEGNAQLTDLASPRIALYRLFHSLWSATGRQSSAIGRPGGQVSVEQRLQALQPSNREALLLTAVEGFSVREAATILDTTEDAVEHAIADALHEIDRDLVSNVLIVEDEAIIAEDLEDLVLELGHRVVGIATTRDDAIDIAREKKPGLVLTDIQLADGSSGLDAVLEILRGMNIPVIFITGYPERLLTGERPEPTYLIAKPFSRDTVRATIGQALFFDKPTVSA
jgi:DNA-directed RNA polymerase specialized sigma24 family protein/CheY-like chemotaxis protein